jgi:hypothetical protein
MRMSDMVLDVNMVPEAIFTHIKTEKVKFHEENGTFVLTPVTGKEETFDHLIGMFSDGKLSIDGYLKKTTMDHL